MALKDKAADARGVALKYLSFRDRSITEVRNKLIQKGFDGPDIDSTIDYLMTAGYLNDDKFACSLVSSRIKNKFWGPAKISAELASKGISREAIAKALPSGEAFENAAVDALKKWLRKNRLAMPLNAGESVRANRFLKGLGYQTYIVMKVLGRRHNQEA